MVMHTWKESYYGGKGLGGEERGRLSYPPSSSTHYICNSGVILGSYWHYTFLTSPCLPLPLKERSIGNCS
uniref:Uncharacterized protein n=2 Tax=Picea TaxID=3328 RepID=A0A101M585_PICGL|nr:hypothetical protein ABT39_MTgene1025 [Picea glauca]QHR90054.1 hypothetical protein Q903MT_gene4077 [Picea sitchensis]